MMKINLQVKGCYEGESIIAKGDDEIVTIRRDSDGYKLMIREEKDHLGDYEYHRIIKIYGVYGGVNND